MSGSDIADADAGKSDGNIVVDVLLQPVAEAAELVRTPGLAVYVRDDVADPITVAVNQRQRCVRESIAVAQLARCLVASLRA